MSARSVAIGVVVLLAVATSADAEVRLQPRVKGRAAKVQVRWTPSGPWTPLGGPSALDLNPLGDFHHDGVPDFDANDGSVLAAWGRSGGALALAVGTDRWGRVDGISDAGVEGVPSVVGTTTGWLVAWQSADDTVRVAGVSTALSHSPAIEVRDARLASLVRIGVTYAGVVTLSTDGVVELHEIGVSFVPSPNPIPIPMLRSRIALDQVPGPALQGSRLFVTWPSDASPGRDAIVRPLSPAQAFVAWWVTPSELHHVVIGESGAALPVGALVSRGEGTYSSALVARALAGVARTP